MDIEFDETVLLLDDVVDVAAEEEEALVLLLPLLLIACTWDIAGCGIGCATSIEIVIIKTPDKRLYILGTFNRIFIVQIIEQRRKLVNSIAIKRDSTQRHH